MAKSQRPREGSAKGAESAAPLSKTEATATMNRFKSLTRQLLNVPRDKIDAEQRQFDVQNAAKKRPSKPRRIGVISTK